MTGSRAAPASLRKGLRIYAIGDVHGCLDQLIALHWAIAADIRAYAIAETVLVHLGDYVDRGEDSAGVVCLLAGSLVPDVDRRVDLLGNHEVLMTAALGGDAEAADIWLENGGIATLASYGARGADAGRWAEAIPADHRLWLKDRTILYQEGGYVFVHAGIRPGRPLHRQSREDMLWIREPFLSSTETRPFVVVHGHSSVRAPDVRPNRIGIDTGAAMGGMLTCLVLEDDRMRFLQA